MSKRMTLMRRSRGFSLLELLVVLLLLGAFAGIFAPKIFGQAEKAKRNAAKLEIDQIGQGLVQGHVITSRRCINHTAHQGNFSFDNRSGIGNAAA